MFWKPKFGRIIKVKGVGVRLQSYAPPNSITDLSQSVIMVDCGDKR